MLVFISNFIQRLFRYIISVIFVLGVRVGVVFIIFWNNLGWRIYL